MGACVRQDYQAAKGADLQHLLTLKLSLCDHQPVRRDVSIPAWPAAGLGQEAAPRRSTDAGSRRASVELASEPRRRSFEGSKDTRAALQASKEAWEAGASEQQAPARPMGKGLLRRRKRSKGLFPLASYLDELHAVTHKSLKSPG